MFCDSRRKLEEKGVFLIFYRGDAFFLINIYSKKLRKSICNVEKMWYTLKVDFFDLKIMEMGQVSAA